MVRPRECPLCGAHFAMARGADSWVAFPPEGSTCEYIDTSHVVYDDSTDIQDWNTGCTLIGKLLVEISMIEDLIEEVEEWGGCE